MRRTYSNVMLFMVLCATVLPSHSMESFDKLWGIMTFTGRSDKLFYMVEPQIRLIRRSDIYEQLLLNMGAGVAIAPRLQFWLGQTITNFAPYNNVAEDIANNDQNEYRLWQQLVWSSLSDTVVVRSRLEERHSLENAQWAMRWRNRGYWTIPLSASYAVVLSDEFFINLNTVPWVVTPSTDQNRAMIGILTSLTPNISLSVGYMNQYIFRTPPEDNHALVLNVFVNLAH